MKKYSDAEIIKMTNDAPKPIREVIENVQTALDIAALGQKRGFHIDKIGMLAELNRNMLLGLVSPQEFLQELVTAGIPDKDAREIMAEISQKIFIPLREEMRKSGDAKPIKSVGTSSVPQTNVLPPRDTIIPANPNVPSRPVATSGVVEPHPVQPNVVVPKYAPPARYFHLQNKIPPTTTIQLPQAQKIVQSNPITPKSVEDRKLLGDHEEPHIEFHKGPSQTGAESSLRQVLRTVMAPPANLPGAMVSSSTVTTEAQPSSSPSTDVPKVEPLVQPRVAPSPKPYSSDPYREPIGE